MKKITPVLFITSSILFFGGCQSGKTIRVDSSQVTEYRDLTIRDLDEMSSKMFPKLMQSAWPKAATHSPLLLQLVR